MSDAAHQARRSRKLMGVVLAAVVALVVPAVAVAAPPEGKGPSAPSSPVENVAFEFTSVDLPDTPGADGLAYVVKNKPFNVSATFLDGAEPPKPVAFSETTSTTVWLEYDGARIGTAVDVDPGDQIANFPDLEIPDAASGVTLTLVADTKPRSSSYESSPFDVLLEDEPTEPGVRAAIGGMDGTDTECNPTPTYPICADLVPPNNAFKDAGLLSRGLCSTTEKCRVDYIQALAPFKGEWGIGTEPATLIMKCDKDECAGGAINRKQLVVTLSPNPESAFFGTFTAPSCPAKNTVGYVPEFDGDDLKKIREGNLPFCVDYVQSTRDNAGDTYLYLLFVVDAKVRFS